MMLFIIGEVLMLVGAGIMVLLVGEVLVLVV